MLSAKQRKEKYGLVLNPEQLRLIEEIDEMLSEYCLTNKVMFDLESEEEDEESEDYVEIEQLLADPTFFKDEEDDDDNDEPLQHRRAKPLVIPNDEKFDVQPYLTGNSQVPTATIPAVHLTRDPKSLVPILEKLFSLLIECIDQRFAHESPVLHFAGVMGIDVKNSAFVPPYSYTSRLAGFMFIGRLLTLEYALPQTSYRTLGWDSKAGYQNPIARFIYIRRLFLANGYGGCITELGDLLSYGMILSRRLRSQMDGIEWAVDNNGFKYKSISTSMNDIRNFIHKIIRELTEQMEKDLFFGKIPTRIKLSHIKDDMNNTDSDFSFLKFPSNNLPENGKDVLAEIMMENAPKDLRLLDEDGTVQVDATMEYLKKKEAWLKLFMLGMAFPIVLLFTYHPQVAT